MCDCETLYPNVDVRIARADLSKMGTIRLSELLQPATQRDNRWVYLSKNRFEEFVFQLFQAGMMEMGEEIWWSPGPVCNLLSKRMQESRGSMDLTKPLRNERLINGWNFQETVERAFQVFYNAVELNRDRRPRRPHIITFAMVIRPHRLTGEYQAPTELDPQFAGIVRQRDRKPRRTLSLPYRNCKLNAYHVQAHEFCYLEPMESCTCGP